MERLKEDLRSGALFAFTNKGHTRLKIEDCRLLSVGGNNK